VFVNPRQLDVGIAGIGDNQTVNDSFRDRLRHSMAQETLRLHRGRLKLGDIQAGDEVAEDGSGERIV